MGRIAGPETPPVIVPVTVRWLSTSMTMPDRVLMAEMAVAPPCSEAFAMSAMLVIFGVSLAMTGPSNRSDTPRTTRSTLVGLAPISMPPASRFGQEILTSSPATPGSPFRRSARRSYSSIPNPPMLTMTGESYFVYSGRRVGEEMLDAARRDADGVQHSGGGFGGAGGGIARAFAVEDGLGHESAELAEVEQGSHLRPEAAGCRHNRVLEGQPRAEVNRQPAIGLSVLYGHPLYSNACRVAAKDGAVAAHER